jgi:organic radical activating enzyme
MTSGRIEEIFESIQGEGLYLGERQVFVRLFGCNLGCSYCDTEQASFTEYGPHELFDEIVSLYGKNYHSISFTGGEPLLQKDFLKEVLKLTHPLLIRNYLETNGTLPEALEELVVYLDIISMDIKLPSSTGIFEDFWDRQREFLKIASKKNVFVKMVICDTTTVDDVAQAVRIIRQTNPGAMLVLQPDTFSPVDLTPKLETFKELSRREQVTACVIPQVHRFAGIR